MFLIVIYTRSHLYTLAVFTKFELHLRVGKQRTDAFHEEGDNGVDMLMLGVSVNYHVTKYSPSVPPILATMMGTYGQYYQLSH